jgi:hypothetical protein
MTDDSPPLVPTSLTNDKKSSSWNFDDLNNEDDEDNSNDFFTVLKKNISKNVYLDEEKNHTEKNLLNKTNQRSTMRIDSSELITRCKDFLPLLTDANRNLFSKIKSGENVRMELDSDEDNERTIEMNLMFCPNIDSSSESDDEQIKSTTTLQINKKINPVNIVEIQSDENVNN